jgi:hypothetical protein
MANHITIANATCFAQIYTLDCVICVSSESRLQPRHTRHKSHGCAHKKHTLTFGQLAVRMYVQRARIVVYNGRHAYVHYACASYTRS